MSKTVTLREANQTFARCVREVEAGEEFVITRNGRPVAKLVPVSRRRVLTPVQKAALDNMHAWWRHLETLEPVEIEPFDRDSLYDR